MDRTARAVAVMAIVAITTPAPAAPPRRAQAAPARPAMPPPAEAAQAAAGFRARVDQYVELQKRAREDLPRLRSEASPEKIARYEADLRARMKALRAGARRGIIFTPEAESGCSPCPAPHGGCTSCPGGRRGLLRPRPEL